MPSLFVGHGSPLNALDDNEWSRALRRLAPLLPRPRAVLSISAHWFGRGTFVTAEERPRTIHDFGGFPEPLYKIRYPAPGDPALAERIVELLGPGRAAPRTDWGLDHGTWTVLLHLLPEADVPVVQLSIDEQLPPEAHLELGRRLGPLRDQGVLILGSGNLTHNLRLAFGAWRKGDQTIPPWAAGFDAAVVRALEQRDQAWLEQAPGSPEGRIAHPSPDHYLPLLYAYGASDPGDRLGWPVTGFDMGSLSMRTALWSG
jgi:4,5-DOPA dioxygenase extradiol